MSPTSQGIIVKGDKVVIQPADKDDHGRLDVCPADVVEEILELCANSQKDAGFAYRLISRRMLDVMNSAFTNDAATRARYPVNPAFMSIDDMKMLGIVDGDRIEITSETGVVVAYAYKDAGLTSGTVSICHMWGVAGARIDPNARTGTFTGRLVSLTKDIQSINHMPRMSAVPVNIRRLEAPLRTESNWATG